MRRSRRSSSSDSISSDEKSSLKYRHRRQRSSSSSSTERSKRNRNKKSHKRTRHRSGSARSSSSSSPRSPDKHSKYSRRSKRHSSSSPDMKREKNYDFDDDLNDLYKNEQTRRSQISKIEDDGGGFKPKSFKSSRSTQKAAADSKTTPKLSKEQEHDNAMFGPVTSKSEASLSSQPVQVSVVSSYVKTLMHESLFEDISAKEKRWKLKLLDLIKSN